MAKIFASKGEKPSATAKKSDKPGTITKVDSVGAHINASAPIRPGILENVSLDVILLILQQLHPSDLLHLTLVNRAFRATLLSSAAKNVWASARRAVDSTLPDPPHGLSEVRLAYLLFGELEDYCHGCGRPGQRLYTQFEIMRKRCATCIDSLRGLIPLPRNKAMNYLCTLIPCVNQRSDAFFWGADLLEVKYELDALCHSVMRGKRDAQIRLRKYRTSRRLFVGRLSQVAEAYNEFRRRSDELILHRRWFWTDRQKFIRQKFIDMGYDEQDIKNALDLREVRNGTKPTELVWQGIRSELEPKIQEEAQRRKEGEDRQRAINQVRKCAQEGFTRLYRRYLKTIPPAQWKISPNSASLCRSSEKLASILRKYEGGRPGLPPMDTVLPSLSFPEFITEWQNAFQETLLRRLRTQVKSRKSPLYRQSDESAAADDPLRLAAAVFVCNSPLYPCTGEPLAIAWDECLSHRCHKNSADAPFRLSFSLGGHNLAVSLMGMAGVDPFVITPAEMDSVDAHFVCDTCRDAAQAERPVSGRFVYNWREAIYHHIIMPGAHSKFSLLSEEESSKIVVLEDDPLLVEKSWSCAHCGVHLADLQTYNDVLIHLRSRHRNDMTDAEHDVVLGPAVYPLLYSRLLLP